MTLEQIARLYVIFKTLEPEIKEWIASDEAAAAIKAIAARFVLSDEQERKLPILVLRLVTQDVPPESFKAELAKETGVDENLATSITEALAKEVIGPVAAALRYARVDTNLLGFNAPAEAARPIEQPQPETSPVPATPKPSIATEPPAIPTPAPTPTEPFILHEEPRVNANTSASPNRQPSYAAAPEENLTGKIPPRVVIERVVHYSALRTPLNTAGRGSAVSHGAKPEPKLPQSKWFI